MQSPESALDAVGLKTRKSGCLEAIPRNRSINTQHDNSHNRQTAHSILFTNAFCQIYVVLIINRPERSGLQEYLVRGLW